MKRVSYVVTGKLSYLTQAPGRKKGPGLTGALAWVAWVIASESNHWVAGHWVTGSLGHWVTGSLGG